MADLVNGLGGPSGFGTDYLAPTDDGSTGPIDITSVFPGGFALFGQNYDDIYINNNGNVTFQGPLSQFTPSAIGTGFTSPIIAPFWGDVDTRGGATTPTGGNTTGSDLVWYDVDAATRTVTVTWDDVGYYSSGTDKTDAFQLQLIGSPSGAEAIKFIYQNIGWTAGGASGGIDGLGGTAARAGYSAGDGVNYYELPGSGIQASMLALPTTVGNTGQAGVWEFSAGLAGIYNFAQPVVTVAGTILDSIDFGAVRAGTLLTQPISVTNDAVPPAESLDATVSAAGAATATGSISLLAAGQTDGADLLAGLSTATAGPQRGTVTVLFASDGAGTDGAPPTALPSQTIAVTGTVYDEATPTILLASVPTVHVGDADGVALTIGDAAGYVENLATVVTGTSGGVSASTGALGEIGAGDSAVVPVAISTAAAGLVTGTVSLSFETDGAGTDGAPLTAIGSQSIEVTAAVDNYASAGLEKAGGVGVLTGSAAAGYALDLGTFEQGSGPATADLGVLNTAPGLADLLSGSFETAGGEGYTNDLPGFAGVGAGQADTAASVTLSTSVAGTFTETIVLHAQGSNASGYEGALPDETLTVTGTVSPGTVPVTPVGPAPSGPTASLFPDPHITTFDGLYYSFQTAGEFVLARDTNGGTFQVQARLSAPVGASSYSVITELGIQVGTDRVTIDSTRSSPVWVDGVAASLTAGTLSLAGGTVVQTSSGYEVVLKTGETVTANFTSMGTLEGSRTTSYGISTTVSLGAGAQPDTVQGLLGNDNGAAAKDLTLADGTVLPVSLPSSELYGTYADAWRVTQPTSLLDYGPGQTTATFTDTTYPGEPVTLSSFPDQAVQAAEALASQAGITDPNLLQAAAFDYLVTGQAAALTVEANLQQQGVSTVAQAQVAQAAGTTNVGIIAAQLRATEASAGSTTVDFQVYRSGDVSAAASVGYQVVAPDGSYVGADAFGGTLPSGSVSFAAGQTTAVLPIVLAQGIGDVASKVLAVQVTAPSPAVVIGTTAETTILNAAPTAGPAPGFAVELIGGGLATVVRSGDVWTIDLAPLGAGASAAGSVALAVVNTGPAGADVLGGTVVASGGAIATGVASSFAGLAAGGLFDVATLSLVAGATETLTFSPTDSNATGFLASLATETVIVTDSATPCFASGTRIATRRGMVKVEDLAVGDEAAVLGGGFRPVVWLGRRRVHCARAPSPETVEPVRVRAFAFGDAPVRDLILSPDHAVWIDNALVPVHLLIDGERIVQEPWETVSYHHVELDRHDVLLAEGLTVESYLDTGNRSRFANARLVTLHWESAGPAQAGPCAPMVLHGARLDAIRRRLQDGTDGTACAVRTGSDG